jgi:Xaa-Pro aminopeptidase
MINYQERLDRVRAQMARQRVDYLLVGPSTDLVYLTGYHTSQSERLTLFVLPREGDPRLVMPAFEVARVEHLESAVQPASWTETESPVELLASLLRERGRGATIAIGGQLHAAFLLRIQKALPDARFMEGAYVMDPVRVRKDEYEIEQLRAAASAADEVYLELLQTPLLGRSEQEIAHDIERLLVEKGHDSVTFVLVAVGANAASPHHHVGERQVEEGDAIVLDFGGSINGYHSDLTRTLHVGTPTDEFRAVYDTVRLANQAAFEAVRPGLTTGEVDKVARDRITGAGFGPYFIHRTGHGIGLDVHEPPYLVEGDQMVLEEGMTFSIEPGIYLRDKFGVRIEDIVVVTAIGAERLNQSPHGLQVVG